MHPLPFRVTDFLPSQSAPTGDAPQQGVMFEQPLPWDDIVSCFRLGTSTR